MKRFRFPLQPVLVLRRHHEMRAREAFGAAVQACQRAEEELASVRERVSGFERRLAEGRRGSFSAAGEVPSLAAYRQECAAEAAAGQSAIAARAAVQQRRVEYLETRRNVEVLSRLEQNARAVHRYEAGREEQAIFDELAAGRVARRRAVISP